MLGGAFHFNSLSDADFSFGGNVSPPPQFAGARHRAAVWTKGPDINQGFL
jgi:hypothetical protein